MSAEPDFVLEFATSAEASEDPLGDPGRLGAWLSERGLATPGARGTPSDVTRARHLRAALRSLAATHGGGDPDPRTAAAFSAVSEAAPLKVVFNAGGEVDLLPADGSVAGGLSLILSRVYRARLDGRLERYKACRKCGWVFYDASKNRSRRWCDMGVCGSQTKAQAYRDRKRAE